MAEPFLGEIRTFAFDFAPKGWAKCEGQRMPINQNQALCALLGPINRASGTANVDANAIASVGSDQPHNTMQPYLALNTCIALAGIFPARS